MIRSWPLGGATLIFRAPVTSSLPPPAGFSDATYSALAAPTAALRDFDPTYDRNGQSRHDEPHPSSACVRSAPKPDLIEVALTAPRTAHCTAGRRAPRRR